MIALETECVSFSSNNRQLTFSESAGSSSSSQANQLLTESVCEAAPSKVPRLFSKYLLHRQKSTIQANKETNARNELAYYVERMKEGSEAPFTGNNPLQFWKDHKAKMPKLSRLDHRVLTVPASSAPVERVFSKGGFIMRPHRARLSGSRLSTLIFLKSNLHVVA